MAGPQQMGAPGFQPNNRMAYGPQQQMAPRMQMAPRPAAPAAAPRAQAQPARRAAVAPGR